MSDVRLAAVATVQNPVKHDLYLDASGNLELAVEGEGILQHMRCRFQFFLGEWFLDRREGIPFFREIFTKNPSLIVVRSIYNQIIAGTPGVAAVTRLDLELDARTRTLEIDFGAVLDSGEPLELDGPFVVEI